MTRIRTRSQVLILAAFCSLSFAFSPPQLRAQRRISPRRGVATAKKQATPGKPKKYDDVITKDAKTFPGVFLVHRLGEKIYFEIPQDAMGKLMLWTIEVAKGPPGVSWGGRSLGNRVIRWERRGNKVYLWNVTFEKRAGGNAILKAVESANMDSIIMAFDVAAEGKDRSCVIQVESLFLKDVPDFSIRRAIPGASAVDAARSYLEQVKAFPRNIEIRSAITFRGGSAGLTSGRRIGGAATGKSYTAVLHYSIVQLPDQPMTGRYFDPRVGYFTRSFEDYSGKRGWMENRKFIARFRLKKKDPKAAISEPVNPITFYLSREVPEKWRPYMKKGVEDWNIAFEKAGFKHAIVCKQAPMRREDPSWDPEDARHSVIRWVADPTQNAMGPHVDDPRSGEVVSATSSSGTTSRGWCRGGISSNAVRPIPASSGCRCPMKSPANACVMSPATKSATRSGCATITARARRIRSPSFAIRSSPTSMGRSLPSCPTADSTTSPSPQTKSSVSCPSSVRTTCSPFTGATPRFPAAKPRPTKRRRSTNGPPGR